MAKKRKRKFEAAKAVRAIARERIGTPPPSRRLDEATKPRKAKHKKSPLHDEG